MTKTTATKYDYTEQLTPVELIFIHSFLEKNDMEGLVAYLEDCVLWKRSNDWKSN